MSKSCWDFATQANPGRILRASNQAVAMRRHTLSHVHNDGQQDSVALEAADVVMICQKYTTGLCSYARTYALQLCTYVSSFSAHNQCAASIMKTFKS